MGAKPLSRANPRRRAAQSAVQLLRDAGQSLELRGARWEEQPALFESPGPSLRAVPRAGLETLADSHRERELEGRLAALGSVCESVLEFHEAFDLPREPTPTVHVSDLLAALRVNLLQEEVGEFVEASEKRDLIAIADALADVVYVAYGSAITYGIDLDAVIREVHRANMSKLDENGRPVLREDGKVMKSNRYRRPEVGEVLARQGALFSIDYPAPKTDAC